jgi:peptide/nickel transport system substrate-binding protein
MGVKRGAGKLFLVMIMAIIITGCSSNNDVSTTESDPNRASNEGGTLVIARLSDAENLDQQFMSTINAASVTHHKIYEGLVQRDENSEIVHVHD